MKTSGVSGIPKFGLLVVLGHPIGQLIKRLLEWLDYVPELFLYLPPFPLVSTLGRVT